MALGDRGMRYPSRRVGFRVEGGMEGVGRLVALAPRTLRQRRKHAKLALWVGMAAV